MIALLAALMIAAPAANEDSCSAVMVRATPAACEAAIAAERDPKSRAELYYRRAWSLDELHRPADAAADLGRALALDADNPKLLHEHAYALAELGEFEAALRDLDREIELQPDSVAAYRERTFTRLAAGDLEGAYRDAVRISELDPKNPDAHLLKADRVLWLGRFDEAAHEVDLATGLSKGSTDAELLKRIEAQRSIVILWRTGSGAHDPGERCSKAFDTAAVAAPTVIGDCTAAFLSASPKKKKAEYLTYRSVAWAAGQQDEGRSLIDGEVAAALDPSNPDMLVNVGGSYDRAGRPHAALSRLNRALAIKPSFAGFAARAAARYDLRDTAGAFDDAKKSFDMHPNSVALWVLGDLARDRGDKPSAKLYWMGAWHLGTRDDGLRDRLKSVGVEDSDKEPKP